MATLHYLTLQDMLWIQLQVSGHEGQFQFAELEEGTFYQYAYGQSADLIPQAARFVSGFLAIQPFDRANEATAFVAVLAFLQINGREIDLQPSEAISWLAQCRSAAQANTAIAKVAAKHADGHHGLPDVRSTIQAILERYAEAISELASVKGSAVFASLS